MQEKNEDLNWNQDHDWSLPQFASLIILMQTEIKLMRYFPFRVTLWLLAYSLISQLFWIVNFFPSSSKNGKLLNLFIFRTIHGFCGEERGREEAHFEKEAQLSILSNPSPFLLSFCGPSAPWTHGDSQDHPLSSTNPFKPSFRTPGKFKLF